MGTDKLMAARMQKEGGLVVKYLVLIRWQV